MCKVFRIKTYTIAQERMEFVPRPREPRSGKKEKFREEKNPEKKEKFREEDLVFLGKSGKI